MTNYNLQIFDGYNWPSIVAGDTGKSGAMGVIGVRGETGPTGDKGAQGRTGYEGKRPDGWLGWKGATAPREFTLTNPEIGNLDLAGRGEYVATSETIYSTTFYQLISFKQFDVTSQSSLSAIGNNCQTSITMHGNGVDGTYTLSGHIYATGFYYYTNSYHRYDTHDTDFSLTITPETADEITVVPKSGEYWQYYPIVFRKATKTFHYGSAQTYVDSINWDANKIVCNANVATIPQKNEIYNLINSNGVATAFCQLIDQIGSAKSLTAAQIAEMKAIYGA